MKKESNELKHISVFTIYVEDPDTGNSWGIWHKYLEGQYSIAGNKQNDNDMDTEKANLINLGYKILSSGVRCCLGSSSYDQSIIKEINSSTNNSYILNHVH
jgi:hypothetical protein